MGLDMYLTGKKFLPTNWENPDANAKEDGFRVQERLLELGYWRKHPNLHGYIVQTFADGVDECQDIELSAEDLRTTIAAINAGSLPETDGFFFGSSEGKPKETDLQVFRAALAWVEDKSDASWRSVVYHASW
jgi:hypothetical protein